MLSKSGAAALMSVFFFIGAGTLGQRVVTTLGEDLVTGGNVFTLETSIVVLFFIGGALFVGNFAGVPASTSMTAVGAIAGLGLATGTLDRAVMGEIAIWWIVAPIIGFWVSGVVGRYFYPAIDSWVAIESTEGSLFVFDRSGIIPKPVLGPNDDAPRVRRRVRRHRDRLSDGLLLGDIEHRERDRTARRARQRRDDTDDPPGSAAVAVGAFTIARRTLDTLGNDITDLPLTAAIVACVSSGIVISLSAAGDSGVVRHHRDDVDRRPRGGRATRTVTVKQGN